MPGVTLTDHLFSVPLDHDRPDGEHIEIYAREVVATGREREQLPWLLFLQGGPGMGGRPSTAESGSGLVSGVLVPVALKKFPTDIPLTCDNEGFADSR